MITHEILNRKGARKLDAIPTEVLDLLNKGEIETANLTEWLAINHVTLIETTFPSLGLSSLIEVIKKAIDLEHKKTAMVLTKRIGSLVFKYGVDTNSLDLIIQKLSNHKSDAIRCYAPYLIGLNNDLSIGEKLEEAQQLIADSHFGVRELVWMALRPPLVQDLPKSIEILADWTSSKDENIRRFTTEVTRPRGVWCKHVEELKNKPELAIEILEKLKSDESRYVQNSVANWLNDASKTQPDFVLELCRKWELDSSTKETKYIVKRALRSINK